MTALATDARVIAHPLELVGDVIERQQVAQVAGDRLLRRDRHRDEPRDAALRLVDDRVALDDVEGERRVVGDERPAGLADGRLDQRAHAQDGVADQRLLAVERLARRRRWSAASAAAVIVMSSSICASMVASPVRG